MENFEEERIKKTINDLSINNLRIMLKSKSVENLCDKSEPIYQSKYSIKKLEPDIINVKIFYFLKKKIIKLFLDVPKSRINIRRVGFGFTASEPLYS